MANKKRAPTKEERTFTKSALLQSQRYRHQRVLLNARLKDNQKYTLAEVDSLLKKHER